MSAPVREYAPISRNVLVLYGLPGMSVNFLFALILVMYMKFATDVLGLAPGVIGLIFFASRIWDAISDPLIGSLSDRTKSRFGRRRLWILASSVPLSLAALAMWAPPSALSGSALSLWVGVSIFAFYTAYTLFEVPHMALGAELTQDPKERVGVFGARQIMRTVGLFLAGAVGAGLLESPEDPRATAFWLVACAGVFAVVTITLPILRLPPEPAAHAGRGGTKLSAALGDVWKNSYARMLLAVYFLEQLGVGGIGVLAPYVLTYVLKSPDLLNEMLIAYMVPTLISIPIWMRLSSRYEKRRLWQLALGLSAVGFGALFFVQEGSTWLVIGAAIVAGVAAGCGSTLGQALKADIIDLDELETGERKEGAYFAAWNFVGKLASGVMLGVVGLVLQWVGFVANQEQSELTQFSMRFLMGGMPFLGFGLALVIFRRFSLSEADHRDIVRQLETRQRG
jgi:sugar (glycoside-pentoside-hexuronide) transporter